MAQQNTEYPGEALRLVSVNTSWQLEQKIEMQNEFTSGPIMLLPYFGDKKEMRHGVRSDCQYVKC